MSESYKILLSKIDQFIRKYYINQILRGLILGFSLIGIFYIAVLLLEYYNHFSIDIRTILFYVSVTVSLIILIKFILIPLFGLFRIGSVITNKQASNIIANHFPYIKDKLLNTIELEESSNNDLNISGDLIIASIDKRISELRPIPFSSAINFKRNIPLLRYFAIVAVLFIIILSFSPSIITEGSERLINHRTFYSKPAPFTFHLINDSLYVEKGSDFNLNVKVTGEYAPLEVYIYYQGNKLLMKKISNIEYEYLFRNLNNSIDFNLIGDNIKSENYTLNILPSPVILNFSVEVDVPEYTGETDQLFQNIGDINIPEGSIVSWNFSTVDSESMYCQFSDSSFVSLAMTNDNSFSMTKSFTKSTSYSLSLKNEYLEKDGIINYYINVTPDIYPGIDVISQTDSLNRFATHFIGKVFDDYGFNRLTFNYSIDENVTELIEIPINKNTTQNDFYYGFDFSAINIDEDKKVEYYFEVFDNDKVNGSKSTRSNMFVYQMPSKEKLDSLSSNTSDKMEDLLRESMEIAKKIKDDVKKLKDKNFENNLSGWEQKQMIEEIIQQENSLEKLLDELNRERESKQQFENAISEQSEEILKKQQLLQEMMENLLDEELKNLLEELQKLQDELSPKQIEEITEELDLSYEDLSEQLDRNLEMLKKFDLQNKIENKIDELEELAKDQNELSNKSEDKENSIDELNKEQSKQNEKFEKIKEDYKQILEENKELNSPMPLDEFNQEMNEISEQFNKDSDNLQKNKRGKASKGQKNNSKSLQKMSKAMQKMMDSMQQQQASEDMDDMKQIIENLITFSFDQEKLMLELADINNNDPKIIEKRENQNKLADDFQIINDSIYALAQRVPQLSSLANKELVKINKKIIKVDDGFEETNIKLVRREQQHIMTSANNLALLLGETLESMQNSMSMQMAGNQNCQKGKGKPDFSMMQQMQQSLKDQVKGMLEQMKSGKGKQSKFDKNGTNKRLAQMLAQQEVFRKMLGELGSNQKVGGKTQKILNEIDKLIQDNEKQLVNKNITPELLERQKLILSRLLEAEKSENEREIEKKRKSMENKEELFSNPEKYFEYNDRKNNFSELFEKNNIALKNYYNNKYKKYLKKLNED